MLDKIKNYLGKIGAFLAQFKDVRNIGLLLFLTVLILITWSGVKAIDANYGLQKDISRLEQQNAVKKLANENLELQNDYYNTPQYLELAARQDFGLAAPGETVLVVPRSVALAQTVDLKPTVAGASTEAKQQSGWRGNFDAWMDFFFHRGSSQD